VSLLAIPADGFRVDELHIRPPRLDDIAAIAPAFLDPAVGGEAGLPPLSEAELRAFTVEQLPAMQESGYLNPFVILADGELIGGTTLHHFDEGRMRVEIGYWLFAHARGRGVAARAVRTLADHVFARGVIRLEAVVRPENAPSIAVLERLGFSREGCLRQLLRYGDARADAYLYCLLNDR
jgi:[ribosomal protein S5]-alanine N-acetyltransferase